MKIILDLRYNGNLVDARVITASRGRHSTPNVDVDITHVVDNIVHDAIKRHVAKVARASKAQAKRKGITKP